MAALLKEYLSSGDSEEAMRCVRDLDVPHFHHEVVYEVQTIYVLHNVYLQRLFLVR